MGFTIFEEIYFYLYEYAVWIGAVSLVIGAVLYLILRAKSSPHKAFSVVMPLILIIGGAYLILWNFRIINLPYRYPDTSSADAAQAIQENQNNARKITFKTFLPAYTPTYVSSRTRILSVFINGDSQPQFTVEYHKYLSGLYINSDVFSLAETAPAGVITKETSRSGSCDSVEPLSDFYAVGKNADGGVIYKASGDGEYYLTDYQGTRLELHHCALDATDTTLQDADALKMLKSLTAFNVKTADFTDPRE
ncbi:MAG TPA: hypothetical protein VFH39_05120 [Candidatus Saccharimonadales bacterium]|nr:hypothetical protein [Candidatus Saccharimonadales bacterium]